MSGATLDSIEEIEGGRVSRVVCTCGSELFRSTRARAATGTASVGLVCLSCGERCAVVLLCNRNGAALVAVTEAADPNPKARRAKRPKSARPTTKIKRRR